MSGAAMPAEAKQILQDLHKRFPDYFFARTSLAQLAILDGRPDDAQEMIQPLMTQTRQHLSEAMALASVNAEIAIAKNRLDSARISLGMMQQLDENDPRVRRLEDRLAALESMNHLKGPHMDRLRNVLTRRSSMPRE